LTIIRYYKENNVLETGSVSLATKLTKDCNLNFHWNAKISHFVGFTILQMYRLYEVISIIPRTVAAIWTAVVE
jgi:hypothetical protein